MSYKADFLGDIEINLPTYDHSLASEVINDELDYIHYSVLMNGDPDKRSPLYVALNIDETQFKKTKRGDNWRLDQRISQDYQLDNDYYRNNPYDRGHMARRTNAAWGESFIDAQRADDDTFFFTNATLQHENVNQDEWLMLEEWVYHLALPKQGKVTSINGPFYGETSRTIRPAGRLMAMIPAGFFKVICFINKQTNQLDVRAFVVYQDAESIKDKSGRKNITTNITK